MATITQTKPRKSIGRLQRQRIIGDWLLMAPQLVLFVGLTLLPFMVAVPMLFTDQL